MTILRTLPTSEVFTRTDLLACGWSDGAIARAVRAGRLIRLRHGRFTVACGPRSALLAALASCAGSVASHRSALGVHDLPVVGRPTPVPEVTMAPRRIGSLLDAHLYRAGLPPEHVTRVDDLDLTSVCRTVVDVGRSRPTVTAVAALDKALHMGWTDYPELDDVIAFCRNWPGIRRARRAIALADPRAESPLESVSRLALDWLKLPAPEPQAEIFDEYGRFVGRPDFYWDEFRVFGEADGAVKYSELGVSVVDERRRHEALADLGLESVRWGWDDIHQRPHATRRRIERAFERGLALERAGVRRKWSVRYTRPGELPRRAA